MQSNIIETWQIHNRINLYLIDAIESDDYLLDVSASKGRTVGDQIGHIHNVRLMWLKEAAPLLLEGLTKIEKGEFKNRSHLKNNLTDSGISIEELLAKGFSENRIKGFKPHPAAFFGYLISHESHHRGQIVLTLKQAGHPVSKKVGFGLWEWGTK